MDHVFDVGSWQVDPLGNTLTRAGESLRLEPKAVWVLRTLALRAGEIVTRQALYEEVWRGRPVTDEVLSRCISLLRGALGDDPKNPTYIQTIPGVGYRLVAPVKIPGDKPSDVAPEQSIIADKPVRTASRGPGWALAPAGRMRRVFRSTAITALAAIWMVQAVAVLAAHSTAPVWLVRASSLLTVAICVGVVAMAWFRVARPDSGLRFHLPLLKGNRADYAIMVVMLLTVVYVLQKPFVQNNGQAVRDAVSTTVPAANVIAVLPFENVSPSRDSDYFSDGLTDELVTSLSRVDGLRVIARTTSHAMKDSVEDARTMGRKLGVSKLVSGTVRVDGNKLRISVQLVDTVAGYELWSDTYDGTLDEIFAVQNRIATSIVAAVTPMLGLQGADTLASAGPPTLNQDAYLLVLRARHILKRREEQPIRHAVVLLNEAIALDSAYAAPYVELARAYALLPYYSTEPQQRMFDLAGSTIAAGRANGAAIGDDAEALSAFMAFRSWDWVRAEESFRKALVFDPNNPELYQWYSQFQASLGMPKRSLEFALSAKELDALSPVVNDRLAVAYLWSDQDELAARQFEEAAALGLGPTANPRAHLVLLLRQQRYPEALGLMQGIQSRLGGSTDWVGPFISAQEDSRNREAAVRALAEAERTGGIKPRLLFGAWIYLGEYDRAMDVADALLADPASFDVEFLFSREATEIRRHPKFGQLLAAIGLDRHWDEYGWPDACRRDGSQVRCDT